MSDQARLMEKLKKLLALAADPAAAPNEAETARRQAEALMAKHRIDEAEVLLATGKVGFELTTCYVSTTPHYPGHRAKQAPLWTQFILVGVARFTEVRASQVTRAGGAVEFKVQGTVDDVAMALWLYELLVRQAYQASRKAMAGHGTREANEWRRGYGIAVQQRLEALAQGTQQQASSSTALVVVDTAKKKALDEAFGAPKYEKKESSYSQAGYQAGQQASLHTNRPVGQQAQPRLGA